MSDARKILDEHERLDTLLRDLRVVSKWEPALLREGPVRAQLAKDLSALQRKLHDHFRVEESGQYLGEVEARRPSARPKLEALHTEHAWMLEKLAILELACEEDRGEAHALRIQEHLASLLGALAEHERKETALIKEVFETG